EIKDYQAVNDPTKPLDTLSRSRLNNEFVRICETLKWALVVPGELEAANKAMVAKVTGQLQWSPPRLEPPELASRKAGTSTSSHRKKLYLALIPIVLIVLIGAAIAFSKLKTEVPQPSVLPVTTVEFRDEFLNPNRWQAPDGWSITPNSRLLIDQQSALGLAPKLNYADFEMEFHLKLENAA